MNYKREKSMPTNIPEEQSNQTAEQIALKLKDEVADVYWEELKLPFAKGDVLWVDASLEIVNVGVALAMDDKELVAELMNKQLLSRMSDDMAARWYENKNFTIKALGLKPWILVQENLI